MPDTGAARAIIRFGSGDCFKSLGTVKVPTLIGSLTFHVMASNTPFLLCLKDIDQHSVQFNNLTNVLVKGETLNLRAPGRFKFTLRDNYDFNYKVFVNVIYLDGNKPIITNVGLNFHAAKFKRAAYALSIEVKEIPIKAHNSIVNNTAGPDGLVPTLLVFGVYPRISNNSPPSPLTLQRGEAVKKAMDEVRQLHAKRQVSEALATHNGLDTTTSAALPLQSLVCV
ncbi:hypothetical protein LX36DRAFT_685706 [Colletotrichum falcatum]|nr:hypothetical protein LX36DRAFT_685706 [Colletotrichum falcatum]